MMCERRKRCEHGVSAFSPCVACADEQTRAEAYAQAREDAAKVCDAEKDRLREQASGYTSRIDRAWLTERATIPERLAAWIRAMEQKPQAEDPSQPTGEA